MPNGEVGKSNTIFQFSPLNILYLPLPIATRLLSFLWIKQLHIGRKNVGVTKIELGRFIDSTQ